MKKVLVVVVISILMIVTWLSVASAQESQVVAKNILNAVKEVGDYTVVVLDGNKKWVMEGEKNTPPPYQVLINASFDDFSHCAEAKKALMDVTKVLYANGTVKDKISRVRFSAPHYLRASIGSDFGKKVAGNLGYAGVGPTMFWKGILQHRSFEYEKGPVKTRTWGISIDGCM